MLSLKQIASILLPLFFLTAGSAPATGKEPAALSRTLPASVPVKILEQKSRLLGDCQLILGKNAARFTARKGTLVAICAPPEYNVMLASSERKQYFMLPYKKAVTNTLGMHKSMVDAKKAVPKKQRNHNLHCLTLQAVVPATEAQAVVHDAYIFQSRQKKILKNCSFQWLEIHDLSPPILSFLRWLYDIDKDYGIPLEQDATFWNGAVEYNYQTKSIKDGMVSRSLFDYPQNYQRTYDKAQLIMTDENKATLEEMFR